MELSEIKSWAAQHIPDYNTRTAFTLILEIIYNETGDRIEDIEKFYRWFKEKFNECQEIAGKKQKFYLVGKTEKQNLFYSRAFFSTLTLFYNTWIKDTFELDELKKYANKGGDYNPKFEADIISDMEKKIVERVIKVPLHALMYIFRF